MKSRKVLTILLSLAIMFTFMPAMAFAADYASDNDFSVGGTVTSVSWGSDYHTASVKVKSDGTTKTYNFEFYDAVKGMEATKTDVSKETIKLVVAPITNGNGSYTMELYYATAKSFKDEDEARFDYEWTLDGRAEDEFEWDSDDWYDEMYQEKVFDAYLAAYEFGYEGEVAVWENNYDAAPELIDDFSKVEAGNYAAWYAQKDLKESLKTYDDGSWVIDGVYYNDDNEDVTSEVLAITYPEYEAYTVSSDKKDVELSISVAFNESAVKKQFGKKAKVAGTTGTIGLIPAVDTPNHAYYTEHVSNDNEGSVTAGSYLNAWYIEDDSTYNIKYGYTYDNKFTYDGQSHNIVWVHEPKGVTIKYYVTQLDKNGSYTAPTDADWTTTFPGIKDAGEYEVAIQFVTEKDGTTYNEDGKYHWTVTVDKMPITATFKQKLLEVEYGKYDASSLEAAIKGMLVAKTAPDSTDKIEEAVQKYMTITGLFEDAGASTVATVFNSKAFSDDADLSAALSNYNIKGGSEMTLVIKKAENNVNLKAVSKSYKAKKKTKKLAKKKSFQLEATAQHGTVAYKKVSGNSKITVSSTGKVTVKKGLKKGTYKVKVKAYTEGTANYAAGADTQTIVVKVK